MSYTLTMQCGCVVFVACHPATGIAHTRIIESRGAGCRVRRHEVGLKLFLWEILPEPSCGIDGEWTTPADIRWSP